MSRWLKSVNSLLEQLDGQVETAVEEHEVARAAAHNGEAEQDAVVDSILAKRGYVEKDVEIGEEVALAAELEQKISAKEETAGAAGASFSKEETVITVEETSKVEANKDQSEFNEQLSLKEGGDIVQKESDDAIRKEAPEITFEAVEPTEEEMEEVFLEETEEVTVSGEESTTPGLSSEHAGPFVEATAGSVPINEPAETRPPVNEKVPTAAAPVAEEVANVTAHQSPTSSFELEYKKALSEAREAQKECRTLRRHVVSLNSELEAAEAEIQAQRTELERAAERMEKDRARHKEEKERMTGRHAEELKALKIQHEQAVAELKARSDQQVGDARKRIKEMEERRMQEGGDWTKEMENALQREQESVRRMANLE